MKSNSQSSKLSLRSSIFPDRTKIRNSNCLGKKSISRKIYNSLLVVTGQTRMLYPLKINRMDTIACLHCVILVVKCNTYTKILSSNCRDCYSYKRYDLQDLLLVSLINLKHGIHELNTATCFY